MGEPSTRPILERPSQIAYPSQGAARVVDFGASSSSTPYIVHCRSLPSQFGAPRVVVYSDDGSLRIVDKASANITWQSKGKLRGGSVSDLKVVPNGWLTAGQAGAIEVWDERSLASGETTYLKDPSGAPYLSVAAQTATGSFTLAAGRELQNGEGIVDIWDIRSPGAPVFSYSESHSDDVTALAFSDEFPSILLSGSTDGLLVSYDLSIGADEDDAVIAVGNTGASLAKIGWGGAKAGTGKLFVKPGEDDEKLDEEAAQRPRRAIGCAWAVSDMQTLSIWDADRFDQILEPYDTRQPYSIKPAWESDFVIDAGDATSVGTPNLADGVILFTGDPNGGVAMIHAPSPTSPSSGRPNWSLLGLLPSASSIPTQSGHSDIVRSLDLDIATETITTGGEDGRLCIWSLQGSQVDPDNILLPTSADAALSNAAAVAAVSGALGGSSTGGSKDRNSPLGAGGRNRFKPYG